MTQKTKQLHRRRFLKTTVAAAGAAVSLPTIIPSSALGRDGAVAPSERVTVGRYRYWQPRNVRPGLFS